MSLHTYIQTHMDAYICLPQALNYNLLFYCNFKGKIINCYVILFSTGSPSLSIPLLQSNCTSTIIFHRVCLLAIATICIYLLELEHFVVHLCMSVRGLENIAINNNYDELIAIMSTFYDFKCHKGNIKYIYIYI